MAEEQRDEGPNGPSLSDVTSRPGVPNLDRVLGGGIRRRSTVMVIGAPGTGKTILAQQIAFHGAARGEAALILTGLLRDPRQAARPQPGLRFFVPELIGDLIQFTSLTDVLRQGAAETIEAIVATAREQRARLVVLDGFRGMREILAEQEQIVPVPVYAGGQAGAAGGHDPDRRRRRPRRVGPLPRVDRLRRDHRAPTPAPGQPLTAPAWKSSRSEDAAPLDGIHPYTIDADGLDVYPRFESVAMPRGARLGPRPARLRPARRRRLSWAAA